MPDFPLLLILLQLAVKDRTQLVLETIALRHQLAVYKRSIKRPNINDGEPIGAQSIVARERALFAERSLPARVVEYMSLGCWRSRVGFSGATAKGPRKQTQAPVENVLGARLSTWTGRPSWK